MLTSVNLLLYSFTLVQNDIVQQGQPVIFRVRGWRVVPLVGNALINETLYASYTETEDHIPADLKSEFTTMG